MFLPLVRPLIVEANRFLGKSLIQHVLSHCHNYFVTEFFTIFHHFSSFSISLFINSP